MSDSPHPPAPEKKPCSKCGHPIVELKSSTTIFDIEGVGDGDWTPHTSHLCNLHRENGQLRAEVERYEHRDTPGREPEAWAVRDVENKLIYSTHLKKNAEEFARGYGINPIGSNARIVPLFAGEEEKTPEPVGWIVQIGEASWAQQSVMVGGSERLVRTGLRATAFVFDTEEKAQAWAARCKEADWSTGWGAEERKRRDGDPVVLPVDAHGAVIEKPFQDAAVLVPHGVAPRSAISPGTLAAVDEALQKKPETEHRPGNIETILHVCSGHMLEVNKANNGHYLISVRDRGTACAAPARALICLVPGEARDLRNALGADEELQKLQDALYKLRRRIETGLLPLHGVLVALQELR